MRLYEAWDEIDVPMAAVDAVPTAFFERLPSDEGTQGPDVPVPDNVITIPSEDDKPVQTLFTMGKRMQEGLASLGITTIGHLRAWMEDPAKVDEMLKSPDIDVGPGSIRRFKMYLGIRS